MVFLTLLVAWGTFFSGACQAPGGQVQQQAVSFTDKNWQLSKLTVAPEVDWDMDGKPDKDIFALLEHCEQDDILFLRKDHRVIRGSGEEKCEEDEKNRYDNGSWTYNEKKQVLILDEVDKTEEYTVAESAAGSLTLLYRFNTTDGKPHTMTAVFKLKP